MDGVLPYDWRLVVHDQGGTHRVRGLSLAPGQTVEAYPGASLISKSLRQEASAAVRLVAVVSPVSMSPVSMPPPVSMAPTVSYSPTSVYSPHSRVCIHDARLGNHDRRFRHDHGRWVHDHGAAGQPRPDGSPSPWNVPSAGQTVPCHQCERDHTCEVMRQCGSPSVACSARSPGRSTSNYSGSDAMAPIVPESWRSVRSYAITAGAAR